MNKVNLADVAAVESRSPKGRFQRACLDISAALAGKGNGAPRPGHCPDSDKWWCSGQGKPVRVRPVEYYDGEE